VFTGETDKLMELLLEGYDHIIDVEDEEENHVFDVVQRRNQNETMAFLQSVPSFEVKLLFIFDNAKLSLILDRTIHITSSIVFKQTQVSIMGKPVISFKHCMLYLMAFITLWP
jgi:hypothetical protein